MGALVLLCVACSAPSMPVPTLEPTLELVYTPIATAELPPTATSTFTPTATLTFTPLPSATPTHTPSATLPPTATPTFTPTATLTFTPVPTIAMYVDHYVLHRPIERRDDLIDYIDRSYPYGGTQFGQREVHLGVEFFNPRFTPVLAALDGEVYYAGDDAARLFGPRLDYYGNLVVLAHDVTAPEGGRLFTLYAHLQQVLVATGERVKTGQTIGTIGDTGIAEGPHLHFEVRVGDPESYLTTRNPDLWLKPYPKFGTLVGRLTQTRSSSEGVIIYVRTPERNRETYTYGGDRVNSSGAWGENFTLGDLPVGTYEVLVSDRNGRTYFRETITIENGKSTWLEIVIDR